MNNNFILEAQKIKTNLILLKESYKQNNFNLNDFLKQKLENELHLDSINEKNIDKLIKNIDYEIKKASSVFMIDHPFDDD